MSAADLPKAEQVQAHLAGCFSILGTVADDFRPVWSRADRATRVLFLQISRLPTRLADSRFEDLRPETKAELKKRVVSMRDWLVKALA